jgi:hypothetical protein
VLHLIGKDPFDTALQTQSDVNVVVSGLGFQRYDAQGRYRQCSFEPLVDFSEDRSQCRTDA